MLSNFLFVLKKINKYRTQSRELNLIRNSGLFIESWYLENNPDVAKAKIDPLLHYLRKGGFEGRDPGPQFCSRWYLDSYEDVKRAGLNPLVHYLKYGRQEGREPQPWRIAPVSSHGNGSLVPPDFIIIGAQKAGTTALYRYLSLHPGIIATKEKEHRFFNCEKNYVKGPGFYQGLFSGASPYQLTFDASPGYLVEPQVSERIYHYNPQVKLIALLRNPVDRAYSAWQMYKQRYEYSRDWFYKDWLPLCDNVAIDYQRRSENHLFNFHAFIEEEVFYREKEVAIESPVLIQGFYAEQLESYFKLFRKEQILIIHSDDLRIHTREVLKTIEDFIGIRHYDYAIQHLAPVFEGGYAEKMEERTRVFLNSYYRSYNERLFNLLEINYGW